MAEIIRERKQVTGIDYVRRFSWRNDPESGFSFPCDEQGNLTKVLHPEGHRNYVNCVSGVYDVVDHGVVAEPWSRWEPAIIRCVCGSPVVLYDAWLETCPSCQRDYNGAGQLLAPRSQWGEETGESLADMFTSYDPEDIYG
jgi:hypothetical protein